MQRREDILDQIGKYGILLKKQNDLLKTVQSLRKHNLQLFAAQEKDTRELIEYNTRMLASLKDELAGLDSETEKQVTPGPEISLDV